MISLPLTRSFELVRRAYEGHLEHTRLGHEMAQYSIGEGWNLFSTLDNVDVLSGLDSRADTMLSKRELGGSSFAIPPGGDLRLMDYLMRSFGGRLAWVLIEGLGHAETRPGRMRNVAGGDFYPVEQVGVGAPLRSVLVEPMGFRKLVRQLPCMPFFLTDAAPGAHAPSSSWLADHVIGLGFNICRGEAYTVFARQH